jgi:hypothetical protein
VPKGAFLVLFSLYYTHLTSRETILGTSADDTAIIATHEDSSIASLNLQNHLHIIEKWLKKWKIKVNESKSSHIKFILQKGHCPIFNINQTITLQTEAVEYRRATLRLQVKLEKHVARKRKQIDLKTKEINWLRRKKVTSSVYDCTVEDVEYPPSCC